MFPIPKMIYFGVEYHDALQKGSAKTLSLVPLRVLSPNTKKYQFCLLWLVVVFIVLQFGYVFLTSV